MAGNTLLSDASCLDVSSNIGYGPSPIPTSRDEEIAALIQTWMSFGEVDRQAASTSVNEDQRPTLLAFSERMASRAVRESNQFWILLGLVALGLDGWRTDWRDNALLLCLHHDACQRIRASAESVFADAATLLPANVGAALRAFLKRSPEDQSLSAMGYKESSDADGFRYERTW